MLDRRIIRTLAAAVLGAAVIPVIAADPKPAAEKSDAKAAAKAVDAVKPNAPAEPADMVKLVKGDTLEGWDGNKDLWRVENGVIIGQTTAEKPTKGNTFLIYKDEVKDFELRFSFRISNGNSGCQYRSKRVESKDNNWVVSGYQAEIENTPGKVGFLYHEKGPNRGYPDKAKYLGKVGDKVEIDAAGKSNVVGTLGNQSAIGAVYKSGDWNDYIIIAKGNHLQHYINGVQTVDVIDNDEKNRLMSGVLALQLHAGKPMKVEFKDLRMKQ